MSPIYSARAHSHHIAGPTREEHPGSESEQIRRIRVIRATAWALHRCPSSSKNAKRRYSSREVTSEAMSVPKKQPQCLT